MLRLQYIHSFRRAMYVFQEMMLDRGCGDPILKDSQGYKEWVESMVKEGQSFFHRIFESYKNEKDSIHVMVTTIRKPKLAQLRNEMKRMDQNQLIVLSLFPMSSNNESYLSSKHHPHVRIQLFYCQNMQINITKHTFVPKHRMIPESEKITMKYENFPIFTRRDPVVLYYDFPVGSVIEIEREVPLIGTTKYYRWIR